MSPRAKSRGLAIILLNALLCGTIFAQTKNTPPKTPTAPTAPTVPNIPNGNSTVAPVTPVVPVAPLGSSMQMPQMPSISAPVSGSNFYTPGKQYMQDQDTQEKQTEQNFEKSTIDTALEKIAAATTGNITGLSAWDLNQLAQRGALGSLSSLNALTGNTSLGAINLSGAEGIASQQKILQEILKELNQIKEAQKNLSAAPAGAKPSTLPPKILRFVINSHLIECSQVYFSQQENDGSFLLTGDVRTLVENETVQETFYLLFTAQGTKNSRLTYNVVPTLLQSKPIESDLQRFCSALNLNATRTGNLVTLHYLGDGNIVDLLLDIGQSVGGK